MTFDDLVRHIEAPETVYETERDWVTLPWQVKPEQYLEFAQFDIQGNDQRGDINALSNAKRALECQLDGLMLAFGMQSLAKNVPRKLEALGHIGVISPRILLKINKHRNEVEHDYVCPAHEVVADFVELFLKATETHFHDHRCTWDFHAEQGGSIRVHLGIEVLHVAFSGALKSEAEFSIPASSPDYKVLLRAIGRCTQWRT